MALIPLVVLRPAQDSFDLPKVTVVWIASACVLGISVARGRCEGSAIKRLWPVWLFAATALVTSLVGSDELVVSLVGETGRYFGVVTVLALAVLTQSARGVGKTSIIRVVQVTFSATVLSNVYGFVQLTGLDPFEWTSRSDNRAVFGTFGNANMMSAWTSVVLVLALCTWMEDPVRWKFVPALWSAAMAFSVAMIGVYGALQGSIGLLVLIPFLALRERQSVGWNISGGWLGGFLGALVVLLSTLSFEWWGVIVITGVGALAPMAVNRTGGFLPGRVAAIRRTGRRVGLGTWVVGLIVVFALFRESIGDSISQGFITRGDYYRTAWNAFLDRPITGFGLDTFGRLFTTYRPASNAANYERVLTNSAHSIPLGLLVSGGLLLGIAFLMVVGWSLAGIRRHLRDDSNRNDAVALGTCFLAILLIMLGTVENIGIWLLFFLVVGRIGALDPNDDHKAERPVGRNSARRGLVSAAVLGSIVVSLASTLPLVASIRARSGIEHLATGQLDMARSELQTAVDLAPWVSTHRLALAEVLVRQGSVVEGAQQARRAVEIANYPARQSVRAARFLAASGDLVATIDVLNRTIDRNPNSPKALNDIIDLVDEVGDALESLGQDRNTSELTLVSARAEADLEAISTSR